VKNAVKRAAANEERFQTLFQSAPIGIALHSADGQLIETNRAYQKMLGYTAAELRELGVRRVTHPDDVAAGRRLYEELKSGLRETYQRTKRFLTKDGRVLWTQSTASAIRDAKGTLLYSITAVEDTTERRKAERQQQAFGELGHRLSAAVSEEAAGRVILEIANQLCGWDASYLHLYDQIQDAILPVLTIDTVEGKRVEFPSTTFTLDPSPIMRRVIAHGPLLILRRHPHDGAKDFVPFGQTQRRSAALMYAPIHQNAKTIGVLSIQSYTSNAYGQADLDTLQALGDHCGAALDRIGMASRLQQEQASYRALLEAVPDSMFRMHADGTILGSRTTTNDPILLALQRARGAQLSQVWPGALVAKTLAAADAALRTGLSQRFEFQPDMPEPIRRYEARVVQSGEREVLVMLRDCSEEVRLQREVLNIGSQERQRIGKDLHDDLCQLLTGLGYLAQSLRSRLRTPADESATTTASQIVDLANKALTWTRKLSRELVSEGLDRGGLLPALRDLVATIEQLFRISCSVRWDSGIRFANRTVEEHIYRIIQESITNAVRHGHASRIAVELTSVAGRTVLTVRDNGVGLAGGTANGPGPCPGVGLRNMRYRARQIGAEFDIRSAPRGGTLLTCRLPLTSLPSTAAGPKRSTSNGQRSTSNSEPACPPQAPSKGRRPESASAPRRRGTRNSKPACAAEAASARRRPGTRNPPKP